MLLSIKDILAMIPISRATLDRWSKLPDFPKSIKIGRRVFFRKDDLVEFIARRQGES